MSQRLALGRLHGPILTAYRTGDIDARDIRILTMATMKQQKAWWSLVKDDEAYVLTGQRLKDWLFGGAHIPTSNAIFDVEASGLTIVSDLFGDEAYFADAESFLEKQDEAIHMLATCYEASGWQEAVIMERGAYFASWEHRKTSKTKGGKVFITVSHQGEVSEHEGYITNAEAKRREAAIRKEAGEVALEPELTKPAQNYVDLHRHAAVRADLVSNTSVGLRLVAAHMLCGSNLWHVMFEPQKAAKPVIAESLEANAGQAAFEAERDAIAALLGLSESEMFYRTPSTNDVFARVIDMSDEDVMRMITFLMAETLSVNSPLIDILGETLGTNIRDHWTPDGALFDLIRDKSTLNAMVREYAGEAAAEGNADQSAKTQRTILNACADETRTPARSDWVPRFMAFPKGSYREDEPRAAVDAQMEEAA